MSGLPVTRPQSKFRSLVSKRVGDLSPTKNQNPRGLLTTSVSLSVLIFHWLNDFE
jgi:hypothetical protein